MRKTENPVAQEVVEEIIVRQNEEEAEVDTTNIDEQPAIRLSGASKATTTALEVQAINDDAAPPNHTQQIQGVLEDINQVEVVNEVSTP